MFIISYWDIWDIESKGDQKKKKRTLNYNASMEYGGTEDLKKKLRYK